MHNLTPSNMSGGSCFSRLRWRVIGISSLTCLKDVRVCRYTMLLDMIVRSCEGLAPPGCVTFKGNLPARRRFEFEKCGPYVSVALASRNGNARCSCRCRLDTDPQLAKVQASSNCRAPEEGLLKVRCFAAEQTIQ